jgi:hypothetical protein
MRPRYYCEFCKKAGGSPSHIKRHEAGCTNRPDRVCGMCKAQREPQTPLHDLLAAAGNLEALREAANGCPACMLAAIRLTKWPETLHEYEEFGQKISYTTIEQPEPIAAWKFEDEAKGFWERVNEARDYER